ncbi:hypothetical protein BHE74_00047042, partial [Ensete ventricosum]
RKWWLAITVGAMRGEIKVVGNTDPLLSLRHRPSDLMVDIVNYRGHPANRYTSSGWTSACKIM